MQKHFVTFYSPGTFFPEKTTKEISSWDQDEALKMAESITERYGARPYAFRFSTNARTEDELDSREVASSNLYYFGVKVETLEEIVARNDPRDKTLLTNMLSNEFDRVVTTVEGWKASFPLRDGDVVIEETNDA